MACQRMVSASRALRAGLWTVWVVLAATAVGPAGALGDEETKGVGHGRRATVYDQAGDWKLRTMDGREMLFSDCRGKVVFLNFWAPWCRPCLDEMPAIGKLVRASKSEDIVFLLVSTEKEATVQKFLEKNKTDLPVYLGGPKPPSVFKTKALPVTYILNREGGVAFRCTGTAQWDDPGYVKMLANLANRR